jgi:hypothetical protein
MNPQRTNVALNVERDVQRNPALGPSSALLFAD